MTDALTYMRGLVRGLWTCILQPMVVYVDDKCFRVPLRALYFEGPELNGYGFWGGRTEQDVCARASGIDSALLHEHPEMCTEILNRKFQSFLLCARLILLVFTIYKVWNIVTVYYTVTRPLRTERRAYRQEMLELLGKVCSGQRCRSPRRHERDRRRTSESSASLSSLDSQCE